MAEHVFPCQTPPFDLPNAQTDCIPHTRMDADKFKTKAASVTIVLVELKAEIRTCLLLANAP
jgi:hypothetical protein